MTAVVSLLELGVELGRRHDHSQGGKVQVIPVLVNDLIGAQHVLRGLCGLSNGVLLDAAEAELQVPVEGTLDQVRRKAVITAMRTAPKGGRRVVIVEEGGGLVDCRLRNPPSGATPSPGEATVLAVARAAIHSKLDTCELAVVTYRESAVDFTFRAPIWNLAVRQLQDLPHPALRTLVFVCEAPIDVGLYCEPGLGFRWAIDDSGRLLRRNSHQDLITWAQAISHHQRPLVLFLGAGFSESSKLPVGNRLRDTAIRGLLGIDPEDPTVSSADLANQFYDWIEQKGWLTPAEQELNRSEYIKTLTLEQVVSAEKRHFGSVPTLDSFKEHHDRVVGWPGPAVRNLVSLLERSSGRIILAGVNFDLLIETHATVPLKIAATDEEFGEMARYLVGYLAGKESAVPLLKFHGTIDRPDSCVVSAEQTRQGLSHQKHEAIRALLDEAHPRLWVYVGTSMRDRDLLAVFNGPEFRAGTDEVWVNPYLTESIEDYSRGRFETWGKRRWQTIGDRLITEKADPFFAELRKAWLSLVKSAKKA